jgi:hypothetical protein
LELITRLYFLRMYMPEKLEQAFEQQKQEAESHYRLLERTRTELSEDQIYNRMSVDLRLAQLKSVLEWLDASQKYFQPE